MPYNILEVMDNKEVIDLLTDKELEAFIKSYFDIDHIYYTKYEYLNTIIVE